MNIIFLFALLLQIPSGPMPGFDPVHNTNTHRDVVQKLFSFNTSVSAFMVCVNELTDMKCHNCIQININSGAQFAGEMTLKERFIIGYIYRIWIFWNIQFLTMYLLIKLMT